VTRTIKKLVILYIFPGHFFYPIIFAIVIIKTSTPIAGIWEYLAAAVSLLFGFIYAFFGIMHIHAAIKSGKGFVEYNRDYITDELERIEL